MKISPYGGLPTTVTLRRWFGSDWAIPAGLNCSNIWYFYFHRSLKTLNVVSR
jgi:hypothetical protein